ncbi:hypothetical protein JDV09_07510 [Mycobacterium sp. Y57]|uniref:hypothetical protein n=1 Tax=Mycolicibacterium xanthum TaxID=2796469 RepID=UPI001C845D0E|nr:hypothetical protein [Mycolicibacterium xanthum]MBX7431953.1 hypothetical protein [Mycolicibacterium xanthum]
MKHSADKPLHRLRTPRAAAFAGVLFALLFGAALVLMRISLPEGAEMGSQWVDGPGRRLKIAVVLMPFAGIAFLWFIGVVRDAFGALEDRFFASVFLGSGLLFLAMIFASTSVGAGLIASREYIGDTDTRTEVVAFGQQLLITLSNTYALRMAAVFMISLATIWLKTGLMPRWMVYSTYLVAVSVLVASDVNMWMTMTFPVWVSLVSLLMLERSGVIDLPGDFTDGHEDVSPPPDATR